MKIKRFCTFALPIVGFVVLLGTALLNDFNHYMGSLMLVVSSIALYFLMAIFVADKNWLDLRAVFTGVWLFTIGLAGLRLTDYQEVWQKKTWVILASAYLVFQLGAIAGMKYGDKIFSNAKKALSKVKTGPIFFEFKENRLFSIAVITSLIGLSCFIISVAIKGFIPCFSNDPFAYINFYTKFHVFSVAATVSSGLCYYCIKKQSLGTFKKCVLWVCIFYHMILFPILVVSRGVFVTAAISFTAVVFYLNKKRFFALLLCIVCIIGIYLFTSTLRNFTDEQLDYLFSPTQIEITSSEPEKQESDDQDSTDETTEDPDSDNDKIESTDENSEDKSNNTTFALSPKMAFLYGYLTVGHDNFNEAVQNLEDYTYGTRSLSAFNVILRSSFFSEVSDSVETYFVRPYLNTNNFLGTAYYDFHEFGAVLLMAIFSFVFAALQKCQEKFKGLFVLLALGNTVQVYMLSFFENFTARFEFWMYWGVILILAIASSVCIKTKKRKNK